MSTMTNPTTTDAMRTRAIPDPVTIRPPAIMEDCHVKN